MPASLPPGPRGAWFGLSLAKRFREDPLGFVAGIGREYGDLAAFRMGPIQAVICNHPELIREVLVTRGRLFRKERRTLDVLRQIDGEGLVVTEGDVWARQRRLLQPAFHPRRMETYSRTIVERTTQFLDRWKVGETRNIVDDMTDLTVEIIARLFFHLELASQARQLGEAVRTLSQTLYDELASVMPLPDWLPTAAKRRKRAAIQTLDRLVRGAIQARRASGEDAGDLLSMMLMAVDEEGDGAAMSDEQVRDEAVTMFNAGHDSTAAALAWIWSLIARHPHVESELHQEVHAVLGDRLPTFHDVPRLVRIDQVVRETLRLYPPVWTLFARVPSEDLLLGGYRIPRGAWVYIFPWVTQRDERFFPNADTFDPDRFSPERAATIAPYSWIPFGAGPHACIGQMLAITEMTLIVATTLQRFRLELPEGHHPVVPEPLLAIRPRDGLFMTVHPRP